MPAHVPNNRKGKVCSSFKIWLLKYSGQPQKSNQNHTHTHTHTHTHKNQSKEFLVTEPQNQELVYIYVD